MGALLAVWTILATYDLFLSQIVPEHYAKKAPKAWEAVVITGNWLPWWGWLLVLSAILVAASLEFAIRSGRALHSHRRQTRAPVQAVSEAVYLTAYEVVHYLADESEWGAIKEFAKTPEDLSYNVLLEAPIEFQKGAAEGKVTVYGASSKTHAHEQIDKTFWMSCGLDFPTLFNPNETSRTAPATVEAAFAAQRAGLPVFYSDLKVVAEDVYRLWPRRSHSQARAPIGKPQPNMRLEDVVKRITGTTRLPLPIDPGSIEVLHACNAIREKALLGLITVFGGIDWRSTPPADYDRMVRDVIPAEFWRNHKIDVIGFLGPEDNYRGFTCDMAGHRAREDYYGIWFDKDQIEALWQKRRPAF